MTGRDLGLMGENIFSFWCAEAGLIPNGSSIDKTAWDFHVEFPMEIPASAPHVHRPAPECKVQVKATDKSDRKLPIKLSNLRRLATAHIPCFFIFIEFDGKPVAQRAFLVHVDNNLTSDILKRLHEIDQREESNRFNHRTMTIHYNESHLLKNTSGQELKAKILEYIGNDYSRYIMDKKEHLDLTGFEDGYANLAFTTTGIDNLNDLIDLSLGLIDTVEISGLKATHKRFGIESKTPFLDFKTAKMQMHPVEAPRKCRMRFREDSLSPGLSFDAELLTSPFNAIAPNENKKFRVKGDFFEFTFSPYIAQANYSFSFGDDVRMEVSKFRNALRALFLLTKPGNNFFAEISIEDYPPLVFDARPPEVEFQFTEALQSLENSTTLLSIFDITEPVLISLEEAHHYSRHIANFHRLFTSDDLVYRITFNVGEDGFDATQAVACIFFFSVHIGDHTLGALITFIGHPLQKPEGGYEVICEKSILERKISSHKSSPLKSDEIKECITKISEKYESTHTVVDMYSTPHQDKSSQD